MPARIVKPISNARRYIKYGFTAKQVGSRLHKIVLFGKTVRVHKKVAARFEAWEARVRVYEHQHKLKLYKAHSAESFCWRSIRGSSSRSMHSWAIAVDLDSGSNPMGSHRHTIPDYVFACARYEGLTCGVDWKSRPDAMHLQYDA